MLFGNVVDDPSANLCAHRHGDGFSGRDHFHAALQTVRTVHGDGAHRIFSDVLLHFHDQCLAARTLDFQSVVYARKVCVLFFLAVLEMNVYHRADNLRYVS